MKLPRAIFSLTLLLVGIASAQGQPKVFDFNEACVQAYRQLMLLRVKPALQLLEAEKKTNPNNLAAPFIENYADFFELFFNENPKQYEARKAQKTVRLNLMKEGPANSPLTLFTQAVIYLQWATIDIKFNNRWAAGWAFRDAFKLAASNQKKFPAFTPNYMITGPMQMVAGTIPKNMQWLSNLMGIKGSVQGGQAEFQKFLKATDPWARLFMEEGIFYQCYLQFYLQNQAEEALAFIQNQKLDVVNNHLFAYMAANLNLNSHRSYLTQQIVQQRNMGAEYLQTPVWDFEMAYARLFKLEPDAHLYFERFLSQFAGNFYVKDAWLKLGWHYLIHGQPAQYQRCMQQVLTRGQAIAEADKRALKEAKSKVVPHLLLLKARLLTDGGYPREALQLLEAKSENSFDSETERLEFTYRMARIYDDLKQPEKALLYYDATILKGKTSTEYFAARACLQAGLLCENRGNKAKAVQYYQACINLEGHDFEDALEQRAKAGLARCQGK
ncbi:MAG TPA: hypothetical protein PKD90_01520 [Phnomibacter sp.]|nr:hypothetical protein [Phnomibacter sp.]